MVYDRVMPHSTVPSVSEAAVDGILVFGGGSAVVNDRAAAIGLAENAPFRDLATWTEGGRVIRPRLEAPKCPVFVVQTTPTSASVKVGTAAMGPGTRRRLPMFDPKTGRGRCSSPPRSLRPRRFRWSAPPRCRPCRRPSRG